MSKSTQYVFKHTKSLRNVSKCTTVSFNLCYKRVISGLVTG